MLMNNLPFASRLRNQEALDTAEFQDFVEEQSLLYGTRESASTKRMVREEIIRETKVFLAKGGCITVLPPGPEPYRRSTGCSSGYIDPAADWLLGSYEELVPLNPKQEKSK